MQSQIYIKRSSIKSCTEFWHLFDCEFVTYTICTYLMTSPKHKRRGLQLLLSSNDKVISVTVFQPMREFNFWIGLLTYPFSSIMQVTARFVNNCHYRRACNRLVSTKFWGKYIQKDELKAKFGQNSSIVGTKLKNVLPRLLNKPYVNEVTSRGQKTTSKCC